MPRARLEEMTRRLTILLLCVGLLGSCAETTPRPLRGHLPRAALAELRGTDQNSDGVRDDLGPLLDNLKLGATESRVARLYLQARRESLTVTGVKAARQVAAQEARAIRCLQAWRPITWQADAARLTEADLNSRARRARRAAFDELMQGQTVPDWQCPPHLSPPGTGGEPL